MKVKFEGLILSTKPIFESDKLCEIFTYQYGKIKCLAKGAQKTKSSHTGKCDSLSLLNGFLIEGKSFTILTQTSILHDFSSIRKNFNTLQFSLFVLSCVSKISAFGQTNPALYNLVTHTLYELTLNPFTKATQTKFYKNLFIIEGIISENNPYINDQTFLRLFEEYTGKRIHLPIIID